MLEQGQTGLEIDARRRWLSVLARAPAAEIFSCLAAAPALPAYSLLRGPEAGMTMLRGRMGGGGQQFNLGEMTLSRCSIQDEAGRVGHGYAAGRDLRQVELIARLDAVLQDAEAGGIYQRVVVEPLAAQQDAIRAGVEAKAAATDVKFFTLAAMRS
jgi:alpha-D-ribose 1-methylphosphonate 5-triphosphate synthase subunit PhnG